MFMIAELLSRIRWRKCGLLVDRGRSHIWTMAVAAGAGRARCRGGPLHGWTRQTDWKGGLCNDVKHASHPRWAARASTLPYFTTKFRTRGRNITPQNPRRRRRRPLMLQGETGRPIFVSGHGRPFVPRTAWILQCVRWHRATHWKRNSRWSSSLNTHQRPSCVCSWWRCFVLSMGGPSGISWSIVYKPMMYWHCVAANDWIVCDSF